MNIRLLILAMAALMGCGDAPSETSPLVEVDPTLEWMQEHADDYLHDGVWRRSELERSLWQPELPYARKRLAGYALEDGGWDLLGELSTEVATVGSDDEQWRSIAVDETPTTRAEWLELGERVFWNLPMRRDAYLQWVATRPELWDDVGLQTRDDGSLRGVVKFTNVLGETKVAGTCGLCHGDGGVAGRANRDLDLGKGRRMYGEFLGREAPHFGEWGPGRVDVTDDGTMDPVAIPDLWGVSYQSHLNSSGAVELTSPAALAIRFETQYITGHSFQARPNRLLTWALAMYVFSLQAPERAPLPAAHPGRSVFEASCASCHDPDRGFSGGLVDARTISSDPLAATSPLRGTGYYKTPSLLGVSGGAPYLHDASAATLKELLENGHPHRTVLPESNRRDLIRYLETL